MNFQVEPRLAVLCLSVVWAAAPILAAISPNSLFVDGAVLQRGREVPVCGTAREGEKVTVEFGDQTHSTTAVGGSWRVTLKPLTAGGPFTMKFSGDNEITLKNLLVGDVWVCSGQSNMQFALRRAETGKAASASAKFPNIRFFTVERKTSVTPLIEAEGKWVECTPETAARALVYGEMVEFCGPIYQSMTIESGKAVLKFTHAGTGLVAKGGLLAGFTIAGEDKKFVSARAEIRGAELVVASDSVTTPTAVRYGWGNHDGNLFNAEGLPASPFRTDVD